MPTIAYTINANTIHIKKLCDTWSCYCFIRVRAKWEFIKFWWFSAFILGAIIYQAVEASYAQSKRKNPLDYQFEVDPNPPIVCRRAVDRNTGGYRATPDIPIDPKTVCDPNPEPPLPPEQKKKGSKK